jgi:hypothetical protein
MNRCHSIVFAMIFFFLGQSYSQAADPAFGKQPNIILIMTDDK